MRYIDFVNALTLLIREKTNKEVGCDNINELKTPSYHIQLISYNKEFNSNYREFTSVSIDILYIPKNKEGKAEIYDALDELNEAFEIQGNRVLKVKDRYLTMKNVQITEVDSIGHFLFDLSLFDLYGKPYDYELMQDLELKFKEG